MLSTAVGLCVIPWCKKAPLLVAMMSVIGSTMGVLDTGKKTPAFSVLLLHPYVCCSAS